MPDINGNPYPWEQTQNPQQSFVSAFDPTNPSQQAGTSLAPAAIPGAVPGGEQGGSWFDNFFSNDQGGQGFGTAAIGAASGVAQTFLGFQQLSEGRDQNQVAQQQWQAQFDIQKEQYDRQTAERSARVSANQANATAAGGT